MMDVLKVDNLNYEYSNVKIFDNLSFSLKNDTLNAIIGTNSSGKTTLIKLISGILASNENIELDGISLTRKNLKEYSVKVGIGFCNKFLFEDVLSELIFTLENLNFSSKEIRERLKEFTTLFEFKNFRNKKINDLSTLDKVKVTLISSMIHLPKLVLLDDVFEELTYDEYIEICNYLKIAIEKYNLTILYTTNNLDKCLSADYILFINNSKIVLEGNIEKILNHDNDLSKNGIMIPTMIDLSLKLKFYGLVDKVIMDVESLVDTLWK